MLSLGKLAAALASVQLTSAHGPWSRAIRYASAKHPRGLNLVAFSDRIPAIAGNFLEVYDPHGKLAQRIGR
jgi:hypothetical protein